MFTTKKGTPLETTTVNDAYKRILSKAGLPDFRFHDLRHTAATRMMEGGMHMNVAKEQLGHSTIAITLDLYSHVSASLQEDAVAELDRVFWSQR